jgi:plasmid maintenance system antidote protein VapI
MTRGHITRPFQDDIYAQSVPPQDALERIKALKKERKLRNKHLAKAFHVTESLVNKVLNGHCKVTNRTWFYFKELERKIW